MKINHIIKEFVTPQATAQDPGLEREKDVDVIFYGQMPRDFTANDVIEALEAVLPREYPPGTSHNTIGIPTSKAELIALEIAKHQGAVVTTKPLSIAQKLVKTFQTYGIKCRIDAPGLEEGVAEGVESKGPWLNTRTNKWVAWYKKDSRSDPITISADREEEVQAQLDAALGKIQSQQAAKTAIVPGQYYDFGLTSAVLRDLVGMEKGAPIYLKLGPNKTIDVSTQGGPGFIKGRITNSPAGYGHLFRVSGDDISNSGLVGSTRYDIKKVGSKGSLTRLQVASDGRPYYSTHDLEPGGLDHKPVAVIRVPGRNTPGLEEDITRRGFLQGTGRLPQPEDFASDNDYYDALDAYGQPPANDYEPMGSEDEPDDWFDESKEKVGNMDADAFDDALARLKKLAGAGPLRTVYDPTKRVYKNVPHAVQPAQQPRKAK